MQQQKSKTVTDVSIGNEVQLIRLVQGRSQQRGLQQTLAQKLRKKTEKNGYLSEDSQSNEMVVKATSEIYKEMQSSELTSANRKQRI